MIYKIIIIFILLILIIYFSSISKYTTNTSIINFTSFYSEGPPNDEGLDLKDCVHEIEQIAKPHFNEITFYNPKKLENLGYKIKKHKGTKMIEKLLYNLGLQAFRPFIYLKELEKLKDGDILVHRDINWKKYPNYKNYDDIENLAKKWLDICQFDFFIPHHCPAHDYNKLKIKGCTKRNVIRELGEDHEFVYNFPMLHAYMFVMRKSPATIELMTEWLKAMENDEWLNGELYQTDHHPDWDPVCHAVDQSILSVIIANWIRKGKYNIPKEYPLIYFNNRNIHDMGYYPTHDYLKYLN
jgi:hypothetical protein